MVTLTTEQFDSEAGMLVPVNRVKLDKASDDWLVEIGVFDRV